LNEQDDCYTIKRKNGKIYKKEAEQSLAPELEGRAATKLEFWQPIFPPALQAPVQAKR